MTELTPAERAAELLAKAKATAKKVAAEPVTPGYVFPEGDVPEMPYEGSYVKTDVDYAVDDYVDRIDILDAYRRYIGKMTPKVGRLRESIMISCPEPTHPDKDPSAWINLDKQTWFCGGCQVGGDKFDLAAIHFGYVRPDYKRDGNFPKLRRQMAEGAGLQVIRGMDGKELLVTDEAPAPAPAPVPEPPVAPPPPTPPLASVPPVESVPAISGGSLVTTPIGAASPPPPSEHMAPVLSIAPAPEDIGRTPTPEEIQWETTNPLVDQVPQINWDELFPANTYLHEWMRAVTIDDLTQEYYVFEGLQTISCALGNKVQLVDFKNVKSNLYLCNYGATGVGKSRAIEPAMKILELVMPWDAPDPYQAPTGVLHITSPGSAEALLDQFAFPIQDMSTQAVLDHASVNGIMRIDELASYMSRASRAGSSLKEMLIELYDVNGSDMRHTSRGSGRTIARNPYANIITSTQPKAISAFLRRTDTESGMLNRFIVVFGKPRVAPIAYGGVTQDLTTPAMMLKQIQMWADTERMMVLHGDALKAWEKFFTLRLAPIKTGEIDIESMFSRVDLHLKKIIVLLTANEMLDHPTKEIVERACELFDYMLATYRMFSGDISFSETTECQGRIMQIIEMFEADGRGQPTLRDIVRLCGERYPKEMVQKSIETLIKLDLIFENAVRPTGKGRPTRRYSTSAIA